MACRCWDMGLRPNMTWDELLEEVVRPGKYCTYGQWICPTLDHELRRADKERSQRAQYVKQLKRKGYTEEEIRNRKQRSRSKKLEKVEIDDL